MAVSRLIFAEKKNLNLNCFVNFSIKPYTVRITTHTTDDERDSELKPGFIF